MRSLSASKARSAAPRALTFRSALVAGGLVLASLAAVPAPAIATPLAEKQAQAAELDREVGKLEDTFGDLQERWRGAIVELREAQAEAREAGERLQEAKSDLRGAKVRLEDRALAIYRDGAGANELAQMAEAGSVSDFFDRIDTIQRVGTQDAEIVAKVRSAKEAVEEQEARLSAARDRQAKVVKRAASAKQRMRKVLDQKREKLGSVTAEIRTIMAAQRAAAAAAAAAEARARAATVTSGGTLEGASGPAGTAGGTADGATAGGGGGDASTEGGASSDGGGSTSGGEGSGGSSEPASVPLPPSSGSAAAAASIAIGASGSPYVYGAAGPGSFDCSGLVVWAFAQAGRGGLPHSTYSLIGMGVEVPMDQAQVGDLVFTNNAGHMGIYVGGGSFVHAPRTGRTVTVESLSYYTVTSIRRI